MTTQPEWWAKPETGEPIQDVLKRDIHYANRANYNKQFEPEREWPLDPVSGRFLCTPEKPMPRGAKGLWSHEKYVVDRECSDAEVDYCSCESCGAEWKEVYEE